MPKKAVQLISISDDGKFVVDDEALAIIAKVQQPICVVMIAGMARTGKSFLLSQLSDSPGVFEVGHRTQSCTQGIWMLNQPVSVTLESGQQCDAFFMDCEGLGAIDKHSEHDTRLFAMAALLCSCLVFNSHGTLDESSLSQLGLIANLTKHIRMRSDIDQDEEQDMDWSGVFPSFRWVLRDFMLNLVDEYGDELSPNAYMEKALQPIPGFDSETLGRNRIRSAVTTFFQDRECLTLVRPLDDEAGLQRLHELSLDEMRPQFVEELAEVKRQLIGGLSPKKVQGQVVTGSLWTELVRNYVDAVNTGAVPCVADAWEVAAAAQCRHATDGALARYHETMARLRFEEFEIAHKRWDKEASSGGRGNAILSPKKVQGMAWNLAVQQERGLEGFCIEQEQLEAHDEEACEAANELFGRLVAGKDSSKKKAQATLGVQLKDLKRKIVKTNAAQSRKTCEAILNRLMAVLMTRPGDGELLGNGDGGEADGDIFAPSASVGDVSKRWLKEWERVREVYLLSNTGGAGAGPAKHEVLAEKLDSAVQHVSANEKAVSSTAV
jgi:hypothetical protein